MLPRVGLLAIVLLSVNAFNIERSLDHQHKEAMNAYEELQQSSEESENQGNQAMEGKQPEPRSADTYSGSRSAVHGYYSNAEDQTFLHKLHDILANYVSTKMRRYLNPWGTDSNQMKQQLLASEDSADWSAVQNQEPTADSADWSAVQNQEPSADSADWSAVQNQEPSADSADWSAVQNLSLIHI